MLASSQRTHLAAVLSGPKDIRLETRPVVPPAEGYAQVRIQSTGLCGSDEHYFAHGRNGDFQVKAPLVLGHEAGGIVTALGYGVTHLKVGQRVAIEPGIPCRPTGKKCSHCVDGRYNLCSNMRFCSSAKTYPHLDGMLQGYINHPADKLHPLPSSCTFDHAALAEPLSVVIHASRRSSFQRGQSVLVLGVGSVGILACALAKSKGASTVCAIDINQARLDFVKANGFATEVLCVPRTEKLSTDDPIKRASKNAQTALAAFNMPEGFDIVYECSGVESSIQLSVPCARPGGKVVFVGMGTSTLQLHFSSATTREVDLLGVFRYHDTWPAALSLLGSGALRGVEKMITHREPLRNVKSAFELMSKPLDSTGQPVIKIVVECQPSSFSQPTATPIPAASIPLSTTTNTVAAAVAAANAVSSPVTASPKIQVPSCLTSLPPVGWSSG